MSSWATSAEDDEATYLDSGALPQRSKLVSYCQSESMTSWATSAEDDQATSCLPVSQAANVITNTAATHPRQQPTSTTSAAVDAALQQI
eukprot:12479619-Prorocentrum_lima.AAC.1